jgi:hypothetical protein
MSNKETFSKRHGHFSVKEKEITIREDAPDGLRGYIRIAFYDLKKKPSDLRAITTRLLKTPPDSNNWSEYPNIDIEVEGHIQNCEWYLVYDLIELIIQKLNPPECDAFTEEINEYFISNGIGWKIVNGQVESRGDDVFETAIKKVIPILDNAKLRTARTEISEAIIDLSRRPTPDITGAIQHSLACLECVTREITGDKNLTLGDLMKKHPGVIPTPLDQAVTKIWGYTSDKGRHLKEGQEPEYFEAELVVEVTAAISTYLAKKLPKSNHGNENYDLPF